MRHHRQTRLLTLTSVIVGLVSLAPGARAQNVFHKGLEYSPEGQAVLTGGATLHVSNLGSSGCDGYSVHLGEGEGYSTMADPAFIGPVGATTDWTAYGSAQGLPEAPLFHVRHEIMQAGAQQGDRVRTRVYEDASPMGASGFDLELFDLGGNSLATASLPNGHLYDFPSVVDDHGVNGGCVGMEWDIGDPPDYEIVCEEIMPASVEPVTLADGTQVFGVHRIVLRGIQPSGPPATSMTRVRSVAHAVSQIELTMEALVQFDHHVVALHDARLEPEGGSGGRLKVSNLGSSGCDGFSISLGDTDYGLVAWQDFSIVTPPPVGSSMTAVTAIRTSAGDSSAALRMTQTQAGVLLEADYTPTGATSYRLEVMRQGVVTDVISGHTGPVATVDGWPTQLSKAIAWGQSAKPCYWPCWPDIQQISIPGNGTFQGDGLRVLAEDGDSTLSLKQLDVLLDGVASELYVTEIRSQRDCELAYERHCMALANSTGLPARIDAAGCNEVAENNLVLVSSQLPPNVFGLYFFGPNRIQVPFGNGRRCVGGTTQRLQPPTPADGSGVLTKVVDLTANPAVGVLVPGAVQSFQLWFRDPMGGGARFNLSDAIEISFE